MRRGGGGNNHTLFEYIISLENLFLAWKEFRRGKRKKVKVQQFEFTLEDELFQLHEDLRRGVYRMFPYTMFSICDPKPRRIHKAHIRDRVLHQAVFRVLSPLFERGFIFDSYSSRLHKGTHAAVFRLASFLRKASANDTHPTLVLQCDIRQFFDSIDHQILLRLIGRVIDDPAILRLVELIISSFAVTPGCGLPLGNVTSQLFANIYLGELDHFIVYELSQHFYIRYCDDFVIVGECLNALDELLRKIRVFLVNRLHLELHPRKIIIRSYRRGIDFLGYVVRPYCITLRTRTKRRLFRRITDANAVSYLGMLTHCAGNKIFNQIFSASLSSRR